MKTGNVIRHPATTRRFKEAVGRFSEARKRHDIAVRQMWVGVLLTNFTDEEIALLGDLLCPMDHMLLERARTGMPKAKKVING